MKICTPVQEVSQGAVRRRLARLAGKTDMAEVWLDHIRDLALPALLKNKPLPVIAVCKTPAEGGRFKGGGAAAAKMLVSAARAGADFVDFPFALPATLLKKSIEACPRRTGIIISHHDFKKTPLAATLKKKALAMRACLGRRAGIVKIAVQAHSLADALSVILLAQELQEAGISHILIAMGPEGRLSRVLTPFLGGSIMFAPLSLSKSSAPGQLTVAQLRKAWSLIQHV